MMNDVLFWLTAWLTVLAILDCGIIELSLKGLWQPPGMYRRKAMRWFQVHAFGTTSALFFLWSWSLDGFDVAWKFAAWATVWLYAGIEDVSYYLLKTFYDRLRWYEQPPEERFHVSILGVKFPKELPWLGLHRGAWAWTSNWLLYGVSKLLFNNPNVSVWALLLTSTLTALITIVVSRFA